MVSGVQCAVALGFRECVVHPQLSSLLLSWSRPSRTQTFSVDTNVYISFRL